MASLRLTSRAGSMHDLTFFPRFTCQHPVSFRNGSETLLGRLKRLNVGLKIFVQGLGVERAWRPHDDWAAIDLRLNRFSPVVVVCCTKAGINASSPI